MYTKDVMEKDGILHLPVYMAMLFIREISCLQQEQGCVLMEELAEKATIDEPIGGLEVLQKEDVLKILEMAK